jgi:hypothetical protein
MLLQLEKRQQAVFNSFLRAGTVLKNYQEVLVMLLRLRQCCIHPSLVQENSSAAALVVDSEDARPQEHKDELTRARDMLGVNFVDRLLARRVDLAKERMEREKVDNADADVGDADECPVCLDNPEDAVVTNCMHVFCRSCIGTPVAWLQQLSRRADAASDDVFDMARVDADGAVDRTKNRECALVLLRAVPCPLTAHQVRVAGPLSRRTSSFRLPPSNRLTRK